MRCILLTILFRFPSPAVGTNWPFCVDVPLSNQPIIHLSCANINISFSNWSVCLCTTDTLKFYCLSPIYRLSWTGFHPDSPTQPYLFVLLNYIHYNQQKLLSLLYKKDGIWNKLFFKLCWALIIDYFWWHSGIWRRRWLNIIIYINYSWYVACIICLHLTCTH